jgi:hypothetical protein
MIPIQSYSTIKSGAMPENKFSLICGGELPQSVIGIHICVRCIIAKLSVILRTSTPCPQSQMGSSALFRAIVDAFRTRSFSNTRFLVRLKAQCFDCLVLQPCNILHIYKAPSIERLIIFIPTIIYMEDAFRHSNLSSFLDYISGVSGSSIFRACTCTSISLRRAFYKGRTASFINDITLSSVLWKKKCAVTILQ